MRTQSPSPGSFLGRTLAALAVLVTGVAAVNLSGSAAAPTPGPPLPPGALFGAYVQGDSHTPARQIAAVERREQDIGRRLAIAHHFYPWEKEFPTVREEADLAAGRIPMISWNGKTLNLAIGLGQHDEMIRTRAKAVKALRGKVLIRWMWEMDGRKKSEHTWHPAVYVAAWRHIHDVFAAEGVTNVQWVWCPNATAFRNTDDRNAPAYYPGDEYVDWICADGYNWAPGRGDEWRSFESIYRPFYDWGTARHKPLMVGEFGAQEGGPGDKARWLTEAREALKTEFPRIKAVVYFDADKDYDWRVTTSPETLAAFRDWANDPWFTPDPRPFLAAASARPAVRGVPIPVPPLQFLPRIPPEPPSAPPEPPSVPPEPPTPPVT